MPTGNVGKIWIQAIMNIRITIEKKGQQNFVYILPTPAFGEGRLILERSEICGGNSRCVYLNPPNRLGLGGSGGCAAPSAGCESL